MRTRAVPSTLIVLGLVGIVVIAATGSTPLGSNATTPRDAVVDAILTFFLIAAIPALALYVYGLLYAYDFASTKKVPVGGAVAFIAFVVAFVLALSVWVRNRAAEAAEPGESLPGSPFGSTLPPASESSYDPEFSWIVVLVVIALTATGVLSMYLSARRAREGVRRHRKTVAEAMAAALHDSLDDLRAESDPRRAVIAAYARLEGVLALHELPRRASETPDELLTRVLPVLDVDRRSIRRLTDLFTWAKFSDHDVDADMKEEAIAALVQVRDELRAAAEEAESVRIKSLRARGSPA